MGKGSGAAGIAALLLFAAFAACAAGTLAMSAGAYQGAVDRDGRAIAAQSAAQYIFMKARRAGSPAGFEILGMDGAPAGSGPVLSFVEDIDGEPYRTAIWCAGGMLMEAFAADEAGFDEDLGRAVADLDELSFSATASGFVADMSVGGEARRLYVAAATEGGPLG